MRLFSSSLAHLPNAALKRLAALFVLPFLFALTATPAAADSAYPNKPIKMVVNFAAGGPADVIGRLLAEKMQASLKQPVYVDNKPGSGGNIGAAAVAKAEPDGYTLLVSVDSPFTISPGVYSSLPFKLDELKPVMLLGSSGMAVAVHPSSGVNSMKELIAKGKAKRLDFGSAGNGTPGHIAASMLSRATGVQVEHIPYKGNAPAVTALVAAEIEAGILATPGLVPHFKANRLKALAVTGRQRSPLLPDVPTTAEAGAPDVNLELYYVAMVPAKTSDSVVSMLQKSIAAAIAQPDVQERLRSLDFTPLAITGPKADEQLAKARERYTTIIKSTGMKAD